MLTDKEYKEQGFIGDELFASKQKEIDHLCRIVRSTVERKVFTLDEALDAYEVSRKDYELYLAMGFHNSIQETANSLSASDNALTFIHVINNMLNLRFENQYNKDLADLNSILNRVSKKIEKEKASML